VSPPTLVVLTFISVKILAIWPCASARRDGKHDSMRSVSWSGSRPHGGLGAVAGGRLIFVIVLLAAHFGTARLAGGQQWAYARDRVEAARDLAQHALDCLHHGEDATTKQAKLAAYSDGLQWAKRAVAADDNNADAHYARFANQGRIMQLEGAVNPLNLLAVNRELDRALELNPNHADALAARGGMYRQLPWVLGGNLDKAVDYLSRAIALDPDACGSRIELAETYRDMGHTERSVPLLEKAAEVAAREHKQRQLHQARELLSQLHNGAK
jgi:tetratricopeptide (TPR) repeat protein